jgi:hypothetical protein
VFSFLFIVNLVVDKIIIICLPESKYFSFLAAIYDLIPPLTLVVSIRFCV